MSGVAGGDRISNDHVDSTAKSYIDTVLSRFPGFVSADISGGVAAGKKDHGDIDLIVHIEGNDKRAIKKELQNYLENQSVNKILPFRSEKYKGRRSYNAGELVSVLYPQTDAGKTAQIDNIVAITKDESVFKKSFLDWPAEKQGLVLGLVKVAIQEANDSPVGIKALFCGPETISLSAINNSPSAKTLILLSSTPEDMYEI